MDDTTRLDEPIEDESRPVGGPIERGEDAARRAVLAGIGVVASACDTAESTFDRFVSRGEQVRDDWQARTDEVRQRNLGARGRMRESVRTVLDSVFDTVNVPSKTDIDAVNVKLNVLNRKLDDLQMQQDVPPIVTPVEPPLPPEDLAT